MKYLFLFSCSWMIFGCGSGDQSTSPTTSAIEQTSLVKKIYSNTKALDVLVAYEPGAEPYTGQTTKGFDWWKITEDNILALFQKRSEPVTVKLPKQLSEMSVLAAQGKSTWNLTEIYELAKSITPTSTDASTTFFTILFVKGYLDDAGTPNKSVIGASLTGTTVIVMFKDVIKATGSGIGGQRISRFVEQSTLIHEMGHALGLVNNGVTMQSAHQDSAHGAHCNNPDCVMYYMNEGVTDLKSFVSRFNETESPIMFDQDCLNDTNYFQP